MASSKASPTSIEGDTRRKTLTITLIPTVDSRGEGKKRSTTLRVANEVSEIGDVCQKLKKCVASVQNRIMDSLLPSLVVMGNFGESGHRDEFERRHHFKNLQTIVLGTAFAATLKNFVSTQSSGPTGRHRGRGRFLLLPQWEQKFLGLKRRQCLGRIVLAYEGPSGKALDSFMEEEKRSK
ncbi:hypothetical protein TSMEX_009354 [Taenia solium]|eukprot:TsM_000650700 transcript=TsM_000650700 gene=TsM_000650700